MAIDPNPFICDICGTHKKETNHWWLGFVSTNDVSIMVWDTLIAMERHHDSSKDVVHLCGIACALKWTGQQLERISNLV